jgi:hypothetical protein
MNTGHKDLCRCGSGKRYKHCHMPIDQAKSRRGWMAGVGAVAALVLGVAAWGAISQWQANRALEGGGAGDSLRVGGPVGGVTGGAGDVPETTSPAPQGAFGTLVPGRNEQAPLPTTAGRALPMGSPSSQAVMPGENPLPWQYDVAKNRHYNPQPGHQHWHNGPPPSDTSGAISVGGTNPVVTVGGAASSGLSVSGGAVTTSKAAGSMATSGSEPLAPGENPAPWEYDQARNRHYNPTDAHRHWHSGPPPPVSERR